MRSSRPRRAPGGFTLVELLVVMLIILLLSAAALPAILPALNGRRIERAAQVVYGELTRAHDEAVRANAPRGFRLMPDPPDAYQIDPSLPPVLTASRLIAIEPAPDYREGEIVANFTPPLYLPPSGLPAISSPYPYLVVHEDKWDSVLPPPTVPKSPTMWFFNIRQGDKIRFEGSSTLYTIAGPVTNPTISYPNGGDITSTNAERLINFGPTYFSNPGTATFEFLFLVNGRDDDNDGYTDDGFDGINNDGDVYPTGHPLAGLDVIDPGFNGIDDNGDGFIDEVAELYLHFNSDASPVYPGIPYSGYPNGGYPPTYTGPFPNEFEWEVFISTAPSGAYTILRRPTPSSQAREVQLPTNVVVDLTTWNSTRERSRLPVDPYSGMVDILIYPDGRVATMAANASVATQVNLPFYHFWLTEIEDVKQPVFVSGEVYGLPMDPNAVPAAVLTSTPYRTDLPSLQAGRRLVSVNTQTGQILTNTIETFDTTDVNVPFRAAQQGTKEEP